MTEIYSHRRPEVWNWNPWAKVKFSLQRVWGRIHSCSPGLWWFFGGITLFPASGTHCLFLFCLYQTSHFLPLLRIYVTAFRAHPDVPVRSFITSANSFVAIKVTFTGSKVPKIRMWTSLGGCGEHYSTNTSCICNHYEPFVHVILLEHILHVN